MNRNLGISAKANALKKLSWGIKPRVVQQQVFGIGAKPPTVGAPSGGKYMSVTPGSAMQRGDS